MKDARTSRKQEVPLRRIVLRDGRSYSVRPSFLTPNMTARTDDVEGPLFLRKFGVPYWALACVFGRDPMYWYRMEVGPGRSSIVGTQCFLHAWLKIRDRAKHLGELFRTISQKQLDGRLAARWCSAWHWNAEIRIGCSAHAIERFSKAARGGPVLYEECEDGLHLYAGDWKLDINTGLEEWSGRVPSPDGVLGKDRKDT